MKRILFIASVVSLASLTACNSSDSGGSKAAPLVHKASECPNFEGKYVGQKSNGQSLTMEFERGANGSLTEWVKGESLPINGVSKSFPDNSSAAGFCQGGQIKVKSVSTDGKNTEIDVLSETDQGLSVQVPGEPAIELIREGGPLPRTVSQPTQPGVQPSAPSPNATAVAHNPSECPALSGNYHSTEDGQIARFSKNSAGNLVMQFGSEQAFTIDGTAQTNVDGTTMTLGCQQGIISGTNKASDSPEIMSVTMSVEGTGFKVVLAAPEGTKEVLYVR